MSVDDAKSNDINEAFFDIALAENKFCEHGREDGFVEGLRRGWKAGFDLGIVKGAQIGSEVAFYRGFVSILEVIIICKNKDGSSKRISKTLDSLCVALSQIPSTLTSLDDPSVIETLDTVRAKFKQICSLMGWNLESTEKPIMEF